MSSHDYARKLLALPDHPIFQDREGVLIEPPDPRVWDLPDPKAVAQIEFSDRESWGEAYRKLPKSKLIVI
jgi:hypothetical protein